MLQMCFRDWLGDFSFSFFVSKCNITNYHKSSSAIQMEFHLHINFWKAKAEWHPRNSSFYTIFAIPKGVERARLWVEREWNGASGDFWKGLVNNQTESSQESGPFSFLPKGLQMTKAIFAFKENGGTKPGNKKKFNCRASILGSIREKGAKNFFLLSSSLVS